MTIPTTTGAPWSASDDFPLPGGSREALSALARLRAEAEAEIERLLALVDWIDGDPDLEEDDPCEPQGDEEPSLGSLDGMMNQHRWNHGATSDNELDDADSEPECEDEGADADLIGNYATPNYAGTCNAINLGRPS